MKKCANDITAKRKSSFPYKCTNILKDVMKEKETSNNDNDIMNLLEQQFEQIFGLHNDSNEDFDE